MAASKKGKKATGKMKTLKAKKLGADKASQVKGGLLSKVRGGDIKFSSST